MNTETETYFSEALMAILRLMKTLLRNEREEHVQCSLADVNGMYGQVLFGDEDDLDGGIAAIRAGSRSHPPTVFVAARGVSQLRDGEFLNWLFGGYVHEAGYADPSWPNSMRLTDH